jgi:ketosteroid isomerase-like protein
LEPLAKNRRICSKSFFVWPRNLWRFGVSRILATLTILLCLVSSTFASQTNLSAQGTSEQEVVRQILDLERQSKEAAIHRDVEFAAKTLANDYIAIGPLGQVSTKADILAARKRAQLRYDAFDTSELVVRVYGHTAVVTGRAEVKGTDLGEDFSGPYRFTRIWVKREGRWEAVNYQVTVTR